MKFLCEAVEKPSLNRQTHGQTGGETDMTENITYPHSLVVIRISVEYNTVQCFKHLILSNNWVYRWQRLTVMGKCSYLFRVKSHSQGRDYRILDLNLVESIPSLLFIILFEWLKYIIWPFKLNLNKIRGDLDPRFQAQIPFMQWDFGLSNFSDTGWVRLIRRQLIRSST